MRHSRWLCRILENELQEGNRALIVQGGKQKGRGRGRLWRGWEKTSG